MLRMVLDFVKGHRLTSRAPVPSPPAELGEPPAMEKGEPEVARSKEYSVGEVVE